MAGFTFNSVDFGTLGLGVRAEVERPGSSSVSIQPVGMPASDKVWFGRGESEVVEIRFPVRITGTSVAHLISRIDDIQEALKTDVDAYLKCTPLYTDRQWLARWNGKPLRYKTINSCTVNSEIVFLAQPNAVALAIVSSSRSLTTNPQSVWLPGPLEGDGVVGGNTTIYPTTLSVHNTSGSTLAADALEIWSDETGDVVRYGDVIPHLYRLTLNCELRQATIAIPGGTEVDVTDKIEGSANWMPLVGGIANKLIVIGCSGGTLAWIYMPRFL